MASTYVLKKGVDERLAGSRVTINLDALRANYKLLSDFAQPAQTAAVVKANAYGLGMEIVAKTLTQAGCTRFFVALPNEGVVLRRALPDVEIFILAGVTAYSAPILAEARLTPCLGSLEQIEIWHQFWAERGQRRPAAIHVDTGMNRLGLKLEEAIAFATRNAQEHLITPILLMTHLACADEPEDPMNAEQLVRFAQAKAAFGDIETSIANSGGTQTGTIMQNWVRPGIALYGGAARNAPPNPMHVVVSVECQVSLVKTALAGESVSYGATHIFTQDTPIAVVNAGYADGFHRSLSGSGVGMRETNRPGTEGFIAGHRVPLIGRVTMDQMMFDLSALPEGAVKAGDFIEMYGSNINISEAAWRAGTIDYELLTSLGQRMQYRYVSSSPIVEA